MHDSDILRRVKIKEPELLFYTIGGSLFAGIVGSIPVSRALSTWYPALEKPFFTPPNFIFAPVWTTLYILMGISLYLYLMTQQSVESKKRGVLIFLSQLISNTVWSFLFFGVRSPEMALIEIVLLWGIIAFLIYTFYRVNKKASYLLVPYLLWVAYAAFLNGAIVVLNW